MNPKLDAIRHRIEHEHDLISQRLSWLVTSQAFLLSSLSIALNAPKEFAYKGYLEANHMLTRCVPYGAIACVLVLWLTLIGAIWSLHILRREATKITTPEDLPVLNHAPIRWLGMAAPIFVPAIFLTLWIFIISSRQ